MTNLPEPTICDMNCFLIPGHEGPHQSEWKYRSCPTCRGTGKLRSIEVIRPVEEQGN